ncbi:MAG: hypothetical protein JO358_08340 [Alphaproteobacteria bacterium]|nr:hypothetical protein [Alphaproteobacteria bacterium]
MQLEDPPAHRAAGYLGLATDGAKGGRGGDGGRCRGASPQAHGIIAESVDLICNLAVVRSELGIAASEVWAEMDRRQALLGMAEKLPKGVPERDSEGGF